MTTPLLITKLYIPSIRPEWVPRPRLIERLSAGLDRKLTLISAPAGFGKTTLLSEWVASTDRRAAWVSLDRGDNDPTRFWAYVITALQTLCSDVGEATLAMLRAPRPQLPPFEALLTGLINEIAETADFPSTGLRRSLRLSSASKPQSSHSGRSLVLVLDDYHMIETQSIHDAIAFLLDHLPPQMHLVIASRSDPPLPLSRLRGRGQLTELRTADLRFTPDEAAAFLNQVMGLGLSAVDVAALEARTEGWIVGLQLAALSLQGQDPAHVADFITSFTGSHRYILDYLTDEVLQRQPEDIQAFLLRTAILDRLTGPLCDAVTGQSDGREMLDRLEEANLFVVPLDGERRWYRYHHLFADLLRGRLAQTQPDQVPDLHRRASEWYEQHGLVAEAVGHGLTAGDVDRVVQLVERNAITMMDRGELTIAMLMSWLDALPDEVVRARPWLCVAHAWALAYAGRLDTIELLLQDAERALEKPVQPFSSEAEVQRVAGYISTIQSYMAGQEGNMSLAIELAREALERLPEEELLARAFTMGNLSSMLRMSGDFEAATQALVEAIAIGQAAGDSYTTVIAICTLAARQIIQGQLHRAFATCRDALRLADEHVRQGQRRLPVAGYAHTQLSRVLREWNDLEAAVRHARQGLELCQQWGPTDNLVVCYFDLAKTLQAIGDPDGALGAIQEARQVALDLKSSLIDEAEAVEAELRLAQGDMAAASRWAASVESELDVDDRVSFRSTRQRVRCFTLVRILIAQGTTNRALDLLARLLPVVETGGEMGHAIEILILQAIALQAQGEIDRALASLERALALAEPEDYVRIFIDEGPPMGELLRQTATQGIAPEYVSKLLAALEVSEHESMGVLPPHPHTQPLIEPLSNRELEVLQLLAAGLSNREIAKTLVIALGTVKNHLQNIYGKLDVHNRTQAVHRARKLGLL